jgi:hypothetical protein
MSIMTERSEGRPQPEPGELMARYDVADNGSRGSSRGWIFAGLVAIGVGAWAGRHFGGDLKRYVKMERM